MRYLELLNNYLNKLLAVLGGISLIGLMALATGNVLLRIFHLPYRGAYELVSFMGALVTAFALGYTQQKKDHIVVDILSDKFPKPVQRVLDALNYLITSVLFAVIAWQIYRWGMRISESGELSETLRIAYYPFVLCVSFGFAALSFTLLVDFLKSFHRKEGELR